MKYNEFMNKLKRGEPKHVYLLAGDEPYYIDKAREAILAKILPNEANRQDAVQTLPGDTDTSDLMNLINTAPFFVPKNVLILRDSTLFKESKAKSEDEKKSAPKDKKLAALMATFEDMPDYSYVIFLLSSKADKRRKIYKTVEKCGAVLESEAIRAWNINDWLNDKLRAINKTMDKDAYAYFTGAVSMMQKISLDYLDQQFDKLVLFSNNRRITRQELTTVFAGLPEVSSFALLDAISAQDSRKALMLLRRQLEDGTYFVLILGLLARHVRQLWQAKTLQAQGVRGRALGKPLELNPFIAERLGQAAMHFSEKTLKQAMLELIDADYLLKTGQAGDEVLEHAVILLCQKQK